MDSLHRRICVSYLYNTTITRENTMKIIKRVHKPKQSVMSLEEYKSRKGLCSEDRAKEDERIAILNKLIKDANELTW